MYYILDNKTPILAPNPFQWQDWFLQADRKVLETVLPGNIQVSTYFLGIDPSGAAYQPLLFETMISGGERDGYQKRTATWQQAEECHQGAITLVFEN